MKDQFLFVYSPLVIHTQQVFYSHKRPNNKRVNSSTVSGKDNNYTYLYIHIIHIIIIMLIQYIQHPNTNPIHPIQHPI